MEHVERHDAPCSHHSAVAYSHSGEHHYVGRSPHIAVYAYGHGLLDTGIALTGIQLFAMLKGRGRFSEILDFCPGLTDKVLTRRLKGLTNNKMICKGADW